MAKAKLQREVFRGELKSYRLDWCKSQAKKTLRKTGTERIRAYSATEAFIQAVLNMGQLEDIHKFTVEIRGWRIYSTAKRSRRRS